MNGAAAQARQRRLMLWRAVAFVRRKAVAWMSGVKRDHQRVAMGFSEHAGSCDAERARIAAHHDLRRAAQRRAASVNVVEQARRWLERGWRGAQGFDRAAHGGAGGAQDTDLVDLGGAGLADSPNERDAVNTLRVINAFGWRKLFAVGQTLELRQQSGRFERQAYCASHNWPRPRAATGFIHAGDQAAILRLQGCFKAEAGRALAQGCAGHTGLSSNSAGSPRFRAAY